MFVDMSIGQVSKFDRYGLPYTVILTRGPLASCYGDGCVPKPDPRPDPTPIPTPAPTPTPTSVPSTCYGNNCGYQGQGSLGGGTCYGDRCPISNPGTCYGDRCPVSNPGTCYGDRCPVSNSGNNNPRLECIYINGVRYC